MKRIVTLLAVLAFTALVTISTFAQTNTAPVEKPSTNTPQSVLGQVTTAAKQTVATNINQVMVEILNGVHGAGSEAYHFSKQEIGQGYDYLKSQAPDTVREFLLWQAAKNGFWILFWGASAAVVFFLARKVRLYADKEDDTDARIFMWILRLIACVTIFVSVATYGLNTVKVVVAPRVFIVQYVIDVFQGNGGEYK